MSSELSIDLVRVQQSLSHWFTDEMFQGLVATDAQFRVVIWNRWMEVHSGYPAADVIGRSLFDLYPEAASRGILENYQEALAGHATIVSHGLHRHLLPMPATHHDLGLAQMPQSARIGPLMDAGVVIGTVTVIEDVSERLASEQQLRTQISAQELARATAEKALRTRDGFLSTLSHEMRTPLNAVLGWTRILLARDDLDGEAVGHALRVIERNAAAQARMIDDMLDMARLAAGKLRLEMEPVDLRGVVLAAVDVAMPAAQEKGIALRTSIQAPAVRMLGDPDRLQQVISNVLSNALKFTGEGGSVTVRLDVSDQFARVAVTDSGQGISPEFLPYIFERFRQHDASSARRHGGLGLGLALVRELTDLHGGVVTAASEGRNRGTTITIRLPLTVEDRDGRDNHEDPAAAPSLSGVRVLVVEDDPDARDLAVMALEQRGARVVAASSCDKALELMASFAPGTVPHILVSDIGMAGRDGYHLIREVRALPPEVGGQMPAVAVTGYAAPADVERALTAGFQLHVSKPIDPAELVRAVARLVKPCE